MIFAFSCVGCATTNNDKIDSTPNSIVEHSKDDSLNQESVKKSTIQPNRAMIKNSKTGDSKPNATENMFGYIIGFVLGYGLVAGF